MKQGLIFLVLITSLLTDCSGAQTTITLPAATPPSTFSAESTMTPRLYPETTVPTPGISSRTIDLAATADATVNWRVCDGAELPNLSTDLSPNKEWLIVNCNPNPPTDVATKVLRLDGTALWDVSFYGTFGAVSDITNGEMKVAHWSNDGNYVYLKPYFCCVDAPQDIFFNYFQNSVAVYRLDLRTGEITTTLQPFPGDLFAGYAISFSPTDQYLAYVFSNHPTDLYLYAIQTDKSKTIRLSERYIASGLFAWSSDAKKVVFVAVKQGWHPYNSLIQDGVSYFMLNFETGYLKHLFDKQDIYKLDWLSDDRLILSGNDLLFYDFQDNTFTVVTPTSLP